MTKISASKAKEEFSELITRAAYKGERFLVHRYGKPLVQIIPAGKHSADLEEPLSTLTPRNVKEKRIA